MVGQTWTMSCSLLACALDDASSIINMLLDFELLQSMTHEAEINSHEALPRLQLCEQFEEVCYASVDAGTGSVFLKCGNMVDER